MEIPSLLVINVDITNYKAADGSGDVSLFIKECTDHGRKNEVKAADLWALYDDWCELRLVRTGSRKQLARGARALGYEHRKRSSMLFCGLAPKPADELAALGIVDGRERREAGRQWSCRLTNGRF